MTILAVDAAGKGLSVAVAAEGRILANAALNVGLTHSQRLLPLLESLLKAADLSLAELNALAVVSGPGSFTGLRIGVATAKGLAWALQKPLLAVSTLEAAAYNALPGYVDENILACPVLDARRNEVYTALYAGRPTAAGWTRPEQLWPPQAVSPADLAVKLAATLAEGQRVVLTGDAAELIYADMWAALGARVILAPPERRCFNASACALLAEEQFKADPGQASLPAEVSAFYLRASEAERNRLARLAAEKEQADSHA